MLQVSSESDHPSVNEEIAVQAIPSKKIGRRRMSFSSKNRLVGRAPSLETRDRDNTDDEVAFEQEEQQHPNHRTVIAVQEVTDNVDAVLLEDELEERREKAEREWNDYLEDTEEDTLRRRIQEKAAERYSGKPETHIEYSEEKASSAAVDRSTTRNKSPKESLRRMHEKRTTEHHRKKRKKRELFRDKIMKETFGFNELGTIQDYKPSEPIKSEADRHFLNGGSIFQYVSTGSTSDTEQEIVEIFDKKWQRVEREGKIHTKESLTGERRLHSSTPDICSTRRKERRTREYYRQGRNQRQQRENETLRNNFFDV